METPAQVPQQLQEMEKKPVASSDTVPVPTFPPAPVRASAPAFPYMSSATPSEPSDKQLASQPSVPAPLPAHFEMGPGLSHNPQPHAQPVPVMHYPYPSAGAPQAYPPPVNPSTGPADVMYQHPPIAPNVLSGQMVISRAQYEQDQKDINDLREQVQILRRTKFEEDERHYDAIRRLKGDLHREYEEKLFAKQQELRQLENLVEKLRLQVKEATSRGRPEPLPPHALGQMKKPTIPSQLRPNYMAMLRPQPPPVATTPFPQRCQGIDQEHEQLECPMGCGYKNYGDLLQVHMLESHPELYLDDSSSTSTPKCSVVKPRTIRLVMPENKQEAFQILEDATLRELYQKFEEVSGKDRGLLNVVIGGQLLPLHADLDGDWLSYIPQNSRNLDNMCMMCQFRS